MWNADPERISEIKRALERLPRVPLARLPTPLEPCPRLSAALGGPEIWVKRDDLTGLELSGNKSRMFEYLLGHARQAGIDAVVAGAAVQSNYCRQLAAACARMGIACHLVLRRVRGDADNAIQGGVLLDLLFGAQVEIIDADYAGQARALEDKARQLAAAGRRVLRAGVGDTDYLGVQTCGYVQAALEIVGQAAAAGIGFDQIWHASFDMTQAGLALGFRHLRLPVRIAGVPPLPRPPDPSGSFQEMVAAAANQCARLLGLESLSASEVVSIGGYGGAAYGAVTEEALEAIRLAGRTEALVLDPAYTGKAMAALIDHVRRGLIPRGARVLFLHTGGFPALFAYAADLGLR